MKHLIRYGIAVVAGVVIGGGTAVFVLGQSRLGGEIDVAGWRSDPRIGSETADALTRAAVARTGLFALNREEAVYFTKAKDDQGRAFDPACIYRVSGGALPARWWSITLYAEDFFLAQNGDEAHSIDATQVGSGAWSALVSPERPEGASNWLSSQNAGRFDLLIRFYNPEAVMLNAPETIPFPSVERVSCREGGV